MHICVGKTTIIGSYNGLLPSWHQAIIWTNAGILLTEPLGTNFSEMLIKIHTFLFKKMHFKMSSGKWRPFCLSLNVLTFTMLNCPYSLHQQAWYWGCRTDNTYCCSRVNFIYFSQANPRCDSKCEYIFYIIYIMSQHVKSLYNSQQHKVKWLSSKKILVQYTRH